MPLSIHADPDVAAMYEDDDVHMWINALGDDHRHRSNDTDESLCHLNSVECVNDESLVTCPTCLEKIEDHYFDERITWQDQNDAHSESFNNDFKGRVSFGEVVLRHVKQALNERRLAETEVQLSSGGKVKFGHGSHVKDLKARIRDLSVYRDRQRRGSEARATYSRAVQRLRAELQSALRVSGKANDRKPLATKAKKKSVSRAVSVGRGTPKIDEEQALMDEIVDEATKMID